ncbi:MAG: thioredoxin family protein, partial [Planctomycetaceae bacterium]|nr:thioredoxin family protein [Planctomycetaceae bacterium]
MQRKEWRKATAGLGLLGLLAGFACAAEPAKSGLQWQSDIFAAHAIAVRENKPMLLVFSAEWCGWCKKLEKN